MGNEDITKLAELLKSKIDQKYGEGTTEKELVKDTITRRTGTAWSFTKTGIEVKVSRLIGNGVEYTVEIAADEFPTDISKYFH